MSAKSLNPELITALKRLRLGGMLPTLLDRLTLADKQSVPLQDVLLMLLSDEIARRDSGAAKRRAQQAGLDPDMVLERWDGSAKVSYDKRLLIELCSLRFVAEHRNLVVLGPVFELSTLQFSPLRAFRPTRTAQAHLSAISAGRYENQPIDPPLPSR